MIVLDKQERKALAVFLSQLQEEAFWPPLQPVLEALFRGPDGQVIVPVIVEAQTPSHDLALLMAEKAAQLQRDTGCRVLLAQRVKHGPDDRGHVWTGTGWQSLPWTG